MANNRIGAFVVYVLPGIYEHRQNKQKLLVSLSRKSLTTILGTARLGPAQKEELRKECADNVVGFGEYNDRFYFFHPEHITKVTTEIDNLTRDIKKATDDFEKLYNSEAADEHREKFEFPAAE